MQNSDNIIETYKALRLENPDVWLIDCKNESSREKSLEMAARARNSNNKKHPHQYRIPIKTLDDFAAKLIIDKKNILESKDFDKLYCNINKNKIKGIGLLTLYDTAHRIGMRLDIHPEKIYLHSGAKIGAEKILGKRIKTRYIEKNELEIFSEFTCAEIEDILCLSKGDLSKNICLYSNKKPNSCI